MAPLLTRAAYVRHGLRCELVRRFSGELRGYVQVPAGHELHGETDLRVVALALDAPVTVVYAGGGAHGWFIGLEPQAGVFAWAAAVAALEAVASELAQFEETWPGELPFPLVAGDRPSGERLRVASDAGLYSHQGAA